MIEKAEKTIRDNDMLNENDKILVALSGGADSVCLCLVLMELGCRIGAAHINHMLRKEADEDELFVRRFCKKNGIDVYIKKADVGKIAKERHETTEEAGRRERYEFLNKIADEYGYSKIAVAHNKNDTVETVLLNIARGAGLKGMCAIPKKRGRIIRPLIDVKRCEIEEFLREKGQGYVTDMTNLGMDYARNKMRNAVIPILLSVNENFIDNAARTADILAEDLSFIENTARNFVKKENGTAYINKERFLKLDRAVKARCLIEAYGYAAGTDKNFEKKHIDIIINSIDTHTHKTVLDLPFGIVCAVRYNDIIFGKKKQSEDFFYTADVGDTVITDGLNIKLTFSLVEKEDVRYEKNVEFFDYGKMKIPLKIRNVREGDRMAPMGMNTEKKVKEILINSKIPKEERCMIPVIEENEIICMWGVKRSNLFKIDGSTEKILMIKGEKLC